MKFKGLLFAICYLLFAVNTNAQTLSPTGKISLLTVSPGEELYRSEERRVGKEC